MIRLKRMAKNDKITRTYEITGQEYQLDELEKILSLMHYLGNAGASRDINIFYDGDGAARLEIKRTDKKEDLQSRAPNAEEETNGFSFIFD